jgi:AraC-like DNA-binding protein/quercetin dioxygenase-like cupin family protein
MDNQRPYLHFPIMLRSGLVRCSYHHAPAAEWLEVLPSVLRAGWRRAAQHEVVRRAGCPGQDLLFCRAGRGWIEVEGRRWPVEAGQLAWLCNERPHAHGPVADDPWELYWIRFDGPGLAQLRARLGVSTDPVFPLAPAVAERWFGRLLAELEAREPGGEITLLGLLGELLSLLRAARRPKDQSSEILCAPEGLRRAAEQMRLYPHQDWTAPKLARLADMSVAHFNRGFRRHFATSPRQWVIAERIHAAQRLLTETDQPVGQVAAACGYGDIFHFSRDFRQRTGHSPLAYRRQESAWGQSHAGGASPAPARPAGPTTILQSYYHTPTAATLECFPVVLRAGHLRAAADYVIERRSCPGHDLLYCLAGSGWVRIRDRQFAVAAGEVAWLNGYEPHAHGADPANPWELLWLRMDGAGLLSLHALMRAGEDPVFRCDSALEVRACFRDTLRLMAGPAMHREDNLHVVLARLMAILRRSRHPATTAAGGNTMPKGLATAISRMALHPEHRWSADELARLAGMSVARFYRSFRQTTGSSPIDWLRRERINLAKRRLQESEASIKSVADQAGYNSPFFFSRDFKRYTGQSPSEFRQQEQSVRQSSPRPRPAG